MATITSADLMGLGLPGALAEAMTTQVLQSGGLSATNDLAIATLGKGVTIKTGTNGRLGSSVLVAGTVTVSNTSVTTSTKMIHWRQVAGGTLGHLSIGTVVAATSFVINSSDSSDTSTVGWMLVEGT